ncbi:hypothetical protein ACIGNX_04870 [Actinosynnema sp. NPDC053489]|uniref:hypothetical protein n=1 Tax=Actinosynnema sp. NPDC053489 TaxID=3363916 RepID=UPI0037C5F22E
MRTVPVVALFALCACTGPPADPPAAGPPPSSAVAGSTVLTCAAAPADVVGTALGQRLNHPRQTIAGNVVRCAYEGGTTEVRFETGADAASFARGREEHGQVTDLPGFHDEGYRATAVTGEVVLTAVAARAGAVAITVTTGATADRAQRLVDTLFAGL